MLLSTLTVSTVFCFYLTSATETYWERERNGVRYQTSYEGRLFMLAVPPNYLTEREAGQLHVTTYEVSATVVWLQPKHIMGGLMDVRTETFVVTPNDAAVKIIKRDQRIDESYTGLAMRITSTADISVVMSLYSLSSDMVQLPPVKSYARKYTVLNHLSQPSFLLVLGAYDYTRVTYDFVNATHNPFSVKCHWNGTCESGGSTTLVLNASTFSFVETSKRRTDVKQPLTGTRVTADRPILLIAGNKFYDKHGLTSLGMSNVLPDNLYHTNYILITGVQDNAAYYYTVFILSLESCTCKVHFNVQVSTRHLRKTGDVYTYDMVMSEVKTCIPLTCSRGVQVVLSGYYLRDSHNMNLVPNLLWDSVYTFSQPKNTAAIHFYLHIIVAKDNKEDLIYDDKPFRGQNWSNVQRSSSYRYVFLIKRMIDIYIQIKSVEPRIKFMVYVTGRVIYNAFGTALGGVFTFPENQREVMCKLQVHNMFPGDNIDNDCDGHFDEEAANGVDDDGDTLIDEDLVLFRVNGIWSKWTNYACNGPCGGSGELVARRRCDNPIPVNKGNMCRYGAAVKEKTSSCTVNATVCPSVCPAGKFTKSCTANCPANCSKAGCRKEDGDCYSCLPGQKSTAYCFNPGYQQLALPPINVTPPGITKIKYTYPSMFQLLIPIVFLIIVLAVIAWHHKLGEKQGDVPLVPEEEDIKEGVDEEEPEKEPEKGPEGLEMGLEQAGEEQVERLS